MARDLDGRCITPCHPPCRLHRRGCGPRVERRPARRGQSPGSRLGDTAAELERDLDAGSSGLRSLNTEDLCRCRDWPKQQPRQFPLHLPRPRRPSRRRLHRLNVKVRPNESPGLSKWTNGESELSICIGKYPDYTAYLLPVNRGKLLEAVPQISDSCHGHRH